MLTRTAQRRKSQVMTKRQLGTRNTNGRTRVKFVQDTVSLLNPRCAEQSKIRLRASPRSSLCATSFLSLPSVCNDVHAGVLARSCARSAHEPNQRLHNKSCTFSQFPNRHVHFIRQARMVVPLHSHRAVACTYHPSFAFACALARLVRYIRYARVHSFFLS